MNVVIINGQGGVGKDALVKEVRKAGYKVMNVSSIDPVKKLARKAGWSGEKDQKSRKFLADLKAAMTEYDNLPQKYCEESIFKAMAEDVDFLFIHIREPENIEYVKRSAKIIFSDCNKYADVATLIVRRGVHKELGNPADDEVENYVYDIEFNNNRPLRETGKAFVKVLDDYFNPFV